MPPKQDDAEPLRVLGCAAAADWDVLGLGSASAAAELSPSELRKRYLKLCLRVHPDKNRSAHATPYGNFDISFGPFLQISSATPPRTGAVRRARPG